MTRVQVTRADYRSGRAQVWVRVVIPVPVHFKTSPRTSKSAKNWLRYGQNNQETLFWPYLSQFLADLDVLRLKMMGKPASLRTCTHHRSGMLGFTHVTPYLEEWAATSQSWQLVSCANIKKEGLVIYAALAAAHSIINISPKFAEYDYKKVWPYKRL